MGEEEADYEKRYQDLKKVAVDPKPEEEEPAKEGGSYEGPAKRGRGY